MDRMPAEPRGGFELSFPKIVAGALAAAGAAVASSWLGVAGTVLGAVVGSIIVPVGTALASHPLERSGQVIRESLPLLPEREHAPGSAVVRRQPVPVSRPSAQLPTGSTSGVARRPIRWGMLAVSCLLTLVVGLGLLTAAEEAMGRSFSSLIHGGHGGTTLSHVVHHGGSGTSTNPTSPTTTSPSTGDQTTSPASTAPTTNPTTAPTTTAPTTDPGTTTPTSPAPTSAGAGAPTSVGLTGGQLVPAQ